MLGAPPSNGLVAVIVSLVLALSSSACAPGAASPVSPDAAASAGRTGGAAGAGSTGASGSTGAAGLPGAAGTGAAGTNGTAGASGAAGIGAAGAAGTSATGVAGTSAAGAAGAGTSSAPSTMGTQTDPGTLDDGTFPQPPPYDLTPASLMTLGNAPKGTLSGPTIYTQTGTYTGWSQWKFTYWVYVPAQYKPGHAAAIMIFQDGLKYNGDQAATPARFNTPTVFDNLIAEGSMPVTIGVFIDPGTNDGHHVGGGDGGRARQYDTPNDQYGKFLLTEFIPSEIAKKYDLVTDPDGWAIGGHSSGGIASIIAAWYYPDKLRKVLTASPSFPNTGGKFPGEILKVTPAKPLRIYHLAGTRDEPGFRAANDEAAKDFKMMGYHYRYRPGEDVHYPPSAAAADFPDALRWLWRGYQAGR
jgi:enterochelin esterase-like enzyme